VNDQNLKPFRKGDPRINRKGRPKSFDALRELAQQIAHEEALSSGQPVVINGHTATVAEMILRQWAASKNPQLARAFIEIAFGKVPDNIDINNRGEIVFRVMYDRDRLPDPPA
jgi:hypothetical protein